MGKKQRKPADPERRFKGDDLIADMLDRDKRAQEILASFGLPCFRCDVRYSETLAEGCAPLGLKVDDVLERLNAL